jgi:hypothetical protein
MLLSLSRLKGRLRAGRPDVQMDAPGAYLAAQAEAQYVQFDPATRCGTGQANADELSTDNGSSTSCAGLGKRFRRGLAPSHRHRCRDASFFPADSVNEKSTSK